MTPQDEAAAHREARNAPSVLPARTVLRLDDISISLGARDLLQGVSWHLRPGRRAGLVGRNGAGKTTLLRVITGELAPQAGRVHLRGGVRPGTLPQQAVSGSTATVWDEARSRMDWLRTLEEQLHVAQAAVERGEPEAPHRLAEVTERMRLRGAFSAEERIGEVLHGLGFKPADWRRSCAELSGGWQMRVALARLLLSEPELLLLDEPTNHLDITARSWLASFLAGCGATMILVSHDRHLLDAVCTDIVEIRGRNLHSFHGNLSGWLVERQRRVEALLTAQERQDTEIARLQGFVDRFGAKATKASQARSRANRIERLEAARDDGGGLLEEQGRPRLALPEAPPGALEPVALRGASLGWPGGPDVLTGVELVLERGMRLAVLGPNGCGKSTLLAAIAGTLQPRVGRRIQGRDVRMARYAQDLAQELPAERSAVDAVQDLAPLAPTDRIRRALGALGLHGEDQLRPVGQLSGGEKARVVLAGFACRPANLLLLDEPSNHLDAVTVDELARALAELEGTLVLVTHDRWLVERLATHVAHVEDGRVEVHAGVRPEDFLPPSRRAGTGPAAPPAADGGEARGDWQDRKARQRQEQRARKRLDAVHVELEQAEAALAGLDARMVASATDHLALAALAVERQALSDRIAALYTEWEELEASL